MRFFSLLNFQHVILYIIPTIIFVIVLGLSLGFSHFKGADSEEKMKTITGRYPEGIKDKDAPFPLALILIIAGTICWAFFYILVIGLFGVRI
jgi:hypothetical protein